MEDANSVADAVAIAASCGSRGWEAKTGSCLRNMSVVGVLQAALDAGVALLPTPGVVPWRGPQIGYLMFAPIVEAETLPLDSGLAMSRGAHAHVPTVR